ncbi:ComF family protein [Echinicola vietnamensis]|uniref:Putative amidophosphoribosyltransferase n=1 Tax=Echinicola vietnamensis (strain DSM 17526 / LMG 23754 / KMM 6221) TaxID=926556 RepID=L0FTT5_ECHVK|nr:ComF family protein [Echinicola vietnamensis]AGA77324.1 putative amidophosphoribosyltransferase [Echinicola vietnamensis DSM 17526]
MRFTFFNDFLALVFPQTCVVCRRSLFDFEPLICRSCLVQLPVTSHHLRADDNDLTAKIMGLSPVTRVMAFLRFTKKGVSQTLLHQLKYRNRPEMGQLLGKLYGQELKRNGYQSCWDAVLAIPLHPAKEKRRGYNQSLMFAEGLAEELGMPVADHLVRERFTSTQTNKSRLERIANVENVFSLQSAGDVSKKKVLLVDDVMTTGATLASAANVLFEAGASQVDLAVIAAGK